MKRKRGVAKRKAKVAALTEKGFTNTPSNKTKDQCNLDDGIDNEVNGTTEIGGLQNQKVAELEAEDSMSSFAGLDATVAAVSTSLYKKTPTNLNKSSKPVSSSSTKGISNAQKVQMGGTHQRGLELSYQDPQYKEEELKVALEVIKKVMKMDAAEPFNAPVDPIALGIPDYLDVIDTPMDFGTICYNIEYGVKYKSSKDVMRDVQYIWDNCSKYNKKGHYILELMKRVKTNFTKYWTEAGLYIEQIEKDTCFLSSNPTTTGSINGNRSPLVTLAGYARSLQQDREDMARSQPDQPPLACTESYKSQKRPDHYRLGSIVGCAEVTMRRNPHDFSRDLLDYSFTHPHLRESPFEILQSQSSSQKTEPFKLQQRSYQSHPKPPQLQHSRHQASVSIAKAGPPHTAPPNEPTIGGYPYAHRNLESQPAEYSSCSHQNKISHQSGYHNHQSSLCCSQPYQSQREFYRYNGCSGPKQPIQPFSGTDTDSEEEEYLSSSSLEPAETVAKRGLAKYNAVIRKHIEDHEQLDGITPNQRKPDKRTGTQLESCQEQHCSQPHTFSPQALSEVFPGVSEKTKKKRGPTRCLKVFYAEEKIPIKTNEAGDPIGPEAYQLTSFLGVITRNGLLAPITYPTWKELPEENKEKMWQLVQSKFDIDPQSKLRVLKAIKKKWSSWKALLKAKHYNPHETNEERLADCDERVLPEQWRAIVEYWNSPEAQLLSNRNKANRAHMKLVHSSGTKSFAQVREEQRLKRPDGKEPSEADLFILTRTRKNGEPVCEAASNIISQLREATQKQQGTSQQDTIDSEVFGHIMGKDKKKVKRGGTNEIVMEVKAEAEKIVLEAKAEVLEMKEKMVLVEQTCAQMAVQMAAMMSMMQKNFAATNTPDLGPSLNPDESEHVSASPGGYRTLQRSATNNGKKQSVGRVTRRKK